ncbi:MAG TPA: HAD-IA family hydrolase, partial [Chthonomonadales bacterium]|nr:HAD-IA family hydrolase [Chthonomonadales bacterium]
CKRKILLSNTDPLHWNWILERYRGLLAPFDTLLASHDLGLLKPSAEIYRRVEEFTGLPAQSHLLIDDLERNVEGARQCGWDAALFTGAADLAKALQLRRLL